MKSSAKKIAMLGAIMGLASATESAIKEVSKTPEPFFFGGLRDSIPGSANFATKGSKGNRKAKNRKFGKSAQKRFSGARKRK